MGLLDKLPESPFGLKGVRPDTRAGALPTSQLHAQGSAMKPGHSEFDLDGLRPETREGALATSQLHAQGTAMKPGHSEFDLDGITPDTYKDNAPENASF